MSEELLVRQCAPTLAGIKTGNLFSCKYTQKQALTGQIRSLNRRLAPKGLCLLPLRFCEGRALLYLYRPERLRSDLCDADAAALLREAGYDCRSCSRCIGTLIRRLREQPEFPHEIGLFLSYPPEDVKGFIDQRAANFKYAGLWKVYGDADAARRLFAKYKKCTEIYCRLWRGGSSVEQLAVAV